MTGVTIAPQYASPSPPCRPLDGIVLVTERAVVYS